MDEALSGQGISIDSGTGRCPVVMMKPFQGKVF
jgi:hypothetical protein